MHVLFIPSWYPAHPSDPFGSFFREQALAMKAAGCRVGVIAPRLMSLVRPTIALRTIGRTHFEIDEGLPTFRKASANWTPRIWRVNARRIAATGWQLYLEYRERYGRPDIVHVHSTIMSGVVACKILEHDFVPFVISEHSSAFARGQVPSIGKKIVRSTKERAAGSFAVSTEFCRLLERYLELSPCSYKLMPNMVDQAFLSEPIVLKKRKKKNLLHISMLDRNKNVRLILYAFREAFSGDSNVSLTIGGDGPEREALMALSHHLGINRQVRFLGRLTRQQVLREMASADVFLLSSHYETFSVVLIEALAMGLPLIATRCGGPDDIITCERGILVDIDDISAFSRAMRQMLANLHHYDPEALRASCRADYGPEALSARWLEIYLQAKD